MNTPLSVAVRAERLIGPGPGLSLYSGEAGIVLFQLDLATATGRADHLARAREGARRLVAAWPEHRDDLTLYRGLAGVMIALLEAGWVLGGGEFEQAAADIAELIAARAGAGGLSGDWFGASDDYVGWTGEPALRGDGGIVLSLLRAGAELGLPACTAIAVEVGRRIAGRPVPGHRLGARAGLPDDSVTPGFLSGTAGTVYLLARLHAVTGDESFLRAARSGAAFIREVSTLTDGAAVVPHHLPQGRDLFAVGFCSGSAGVARAFFELYRSGGDSRDLEWAELLARGIERHCREQGMPDASCQCCGVAGLLELFVGLWAGTGRSAHLDTAHRLAGELVSRAGDPDGAGLRWPRTTKPGYLPGPAGIAAALLHLHAAGQGERAARLPLLPDNPFPAIPVPLSVGH
ncbi:lanthionine synthetase LanC family protein [Nonomuraea soli]|uniref:Lantibiotic modifying enzyme n=1 Tax=Nonomuraea soli TaxID=1032476 RepID=A0A7W0HUM1_9ACTN|nr:lanthionine synthetase LanC family protein [Nonomuraea soli]MBA2896230.1 lantibiotic modifying enzyme [Nonomuraea soli]